MRSLCKDVNKARKPANYCHIQHLYRVASGHQVSAHKGIVVRRLDSEEVYDQWKQKWESKGRKIKIELFWNIFKIYWKIYDFALVACGLGVI